MLINRYTPLTSSTSSSSGDTPSNNNYPDFPDWLQVAYLTHFENADWIGYDGYATFLYMKEGWADTSTPSHYFVKVTGVNELDSSIYNYQQHLFNVRRNRNDTSQRVYIAMAEKGVYYVTPEFTQLYQDDIWFNVIAPEGWTHCRDVSKWGGTTGISRWSCYVVYNNNNSSSALFVHDAMTGYTKTITYASGSEGVKCYLVPKNTGNDTQMYLFHAWHDSSGNHVGVFLVERTASELTVTLLDSYLLNTSTTYYINQLFVGQEARDENDVLQSAFVFVNGQWSASTLYWRRFDATSNTFTTDTGSSTLWGRVMIDEWNGKLCTIGYSSGSAMSDVYSYYSVSWGYQSNNVQSRTLRVENIVRPVLPSNPQIINNSHASFLDDNLVIVNPSGQIARLSLNPFKMFNEGKRVTACYNNNVYPLYDDASLPQDWQIVQPNKLMLDWGTTSLPDDYQLVIWFKNGHDFPV